MLDLIDLDRALVLLVLLGAGMFLATLLVRPGPRGSERQESERSARRARIFALRGMLAMTLFGLFSGVAGGLLESRSGNGALVGLLFASYRICWAPAYLIRDLELGLAALGAGPLDSELPRLLGLLLIPVLWFLVFLGVGRWLSRRSSRPWR
jgi:hypothetical protein